MKAKTVWNSAEARWEAWAGDILIARNSNAASGPDYLRAVILGGSSKKAKANGVDGIEEPSRADLIAASQSSLAAFGERDDGGDGEDGDVIQQASVESEFGINERFEIMGNYVDMVARRRIASTVITGEGGLGKSFTVMRHLRHSGLQDLAKAEIGAKWDGFKGYVVVKGYSTAKALFRTLYENRQQIIVFDDCDSILRDPNAVNLLKAALDSYDVRMVTWNAESFGDDDLPKTFEFTGGVIFISNMHRSKVPQAIRSRAMCADVSMTRDEVVERMQVIVRSDEFLPEFDQNTKDIAMTFVAEHAHHPLVKTLNLRSLVNVTKTVAAAPSLSGDWQRTALYDLANS